MNDCPCCTDQLLRHIRHQQIYWFCPSCRQEMPNLQPIKKPAGLSCICLTQSSRYPVPKITPSHYLRETLPATLKIFFTAFNLQLEPGDYTIPRPTKREPATHSPQHTSTKAELQELQQQIRQVCRRLIALMGLYDIEQATLSIKLSPHTSPQLELNIQQGLIPNPL